MAAYTDAATIEAYLGVTFTQAQATAADQVAAAVTAYIDRYTGRSWQSTSPLAGEMDPVLPPRSEYPAWSGVVYLQRTPAVAVTAVTLRSAYPNPTETQLAPTDYELLDPSNGVLTIASVGWCAGLLALVDYTWTAEVPADISLAATMIASGVMQQQMTIAAGSGLIAANPQLAGVQSIAVGQNDVNVTLSATATSGASMGSAAGSDWAAPGSAVAAILGPYRRPVLA